MQFLLQHKGVITALIATLFLSFKSIVAKRAYAEGLTPDNILSMRLMLATSLLLLTLFVRQGWQGLRIAKTQWAALAILGAIGITGSMVTSFESIALIPAGLSTTLTFIYPAFTVILLVPLYRKLPTRGTILAIGMTFVGIATLSRESFAGYNNLVSNDYTKGIFLAIGAASLYAFYNAGGAFVLRNVNALQLAAIGASMATITHIVIVGNHWVSSPVAMFYGVLLGVGCGYLPFLAHAYALAWAGPTKVVVISTIGPLLTGLWAYLLLDEALGIIDLVATGCIVSGIALVNIGRVKQPA